MDRRPPQLQKIPPHSSSAILIPPPNWLPSPSSPFWISLRLYWLKGEALNGSWKQPQLEALK
jgi:hypothetical protein